MESSLSPEDRVVAERRPTNCGIQNMGNQCYMISVLQCLLHTTEMSHFFLRGFYTADLQDVGDLVNLIESFSLFVEQMHSNTTLSLITQSFMRLKWSIGEFCQRFRTFHQEDSQELLIFLLEHIHRALNKVKVWRQPTIEYSLGGDVNDITLAVTMSQRYREADDSFVRDCFYGLFHCETSCKQCPFKSVKFDPFCSFEISLGCAVNDSTSICLQDLLHAAFGSEDITWHAKDGCANCKCDVQAGKRLQIWDSPGILIVLLKRFKTVTDGKQFCSVRVDTLVNVPGLEVDFAPYFAPHSPEKHKNQNYRLYAVCNHIGQIDAGHYTAYCRPNDGNEWYEFDDGCVKTVSCDAVMTKAAYVLFFRRTGSPCTLENLKTRDSRCHENSEWIKKLPMQRTTSAFSSVSPHWSSQSPLPPQDHRLACSSILKSNHDRSLGILVSAQKLHAQAPKALGTTVLHLGDALNIFLKDKLQTDCFDVLKNFQLTPCFAEGSEHEPQSIFDHGSSINALCAAAISLGNQKATPQSLCHNIAHLIEGDVFEFSSNPVFKGSVQWLTASKFLRSQMSSISAAELPEYAQKLRSCWKPDSNPFWFGCLEIAAFAHVFGCEVHVYSFWGGCVPITFSSRTAADDSAEPVAKSVSALPK